jgi:hypothetical protein
MDADFADAHNRHWDDAERLFFAERWANADHLYGVAAECGLKRLMQVFGMDVGKDGSPKKSDDRKHIDKIWHRYETYRSGHAQGASYSLPTISRSPFDNWEASQRYAKESAFHQGHVAPHRSGAEFVRRLLAQARRDGLL